MSLVCEKQALSHSAILEAAECLYSTVNAWEGETGGEASNIQQGLATLTRYSVASFLGSFHWNVNTKL